MAIWFKYSIKCKFNLKNDIKNMAWKVVRPQNLSDKILRTQPQVKRIRFYYYYIYTWVVFKLYFV